MTWVLILTIWKGESIAVTTAEFTNSPACLVAGNLAVSHFAPLMSTKGASFVCVAK